MENWQSRNPAHLVHNFIMDSEATHSDEEKATNIQDTLMEDAKEKNDTNKSKMNTKKQGSNNNENKMDMDKNQETQHNDTDERTNMDTNKSGIQYNKAELKKQQAQELEKGKTSNNGWMDVQSSRKAETRKEKQTNTSKTKELTGKIFDKSVKVELRNLCQVKITDSCNRHHTYFAALLSLLTFPHTRNHLTSS
jgi:hypothetical protein